MSQLNNIALAEKLAILDADYWEERRLPIRGDGSTGALQKLAGDKAPMEGGEDPAQLSISRRQNSGEKKVLTAGKR